MALFFGIFAFLLVVIAAMAVGVLNGREPIKGSCGGLNRLGMRDGECPICGDDPSQCTSETSEGSAPKAPSVAQRAAELSRSADQPKHRDR